MRRGGPSVDAMPSGGDAKLLAHYSVASFVVAAAAAAAGFVTPPPPSSQCVRRSFDFNMVVVAVVRCLVLRRVLVLPGRVLVRNPFGTRDRPLLPLQTRETSIKSERKRQRFINVFHSYPDCSRSPELDRWTKRLPRKKNVVRLLVAFPLGLRFESTTPPPSMSANLLPIPRRSLLVMCLYITLYILLIMEQMCLWVSRVLWYLLLRCTHIGGTCARMYNRRRRIAFTS